MREPLDFSHVEVWKEDDTWYADVVCEDKTRFQVDIEPSDDTVHFLHDDISVKHFANTAGDYRVNRCIIASDRKEVAQRINHHDHWEQRRYG